MDAFQDLAIIEEKPKRPYEQVNPKTPFTDKELAFLEIYCHKGGSIEKAVYKAGYTHCSLQQRYRIGKNIVKKYEMAGLGNAQTFRDVGFGELTIAQVIKKTGLKGKSEIANLRACELAMRGIGMLEKEQVGQVGVTVVIQAAPGSATQVNISEQPKQILPESNPPPATSYDGAPAYDPNGKPLKISK